LSGCAAAIFHTGATREDAAGDALFDAALPLNGLWRLCQCSGRYQRGQKIAAAHAYLL
jgi:hypothetical protein